MYGAFEENPASDFSAAAAVNASWRAAQRPADALYRLLGGCQSESWISAACKSSCENANDPEGLNIRPCLAWKAFTPRRLHPNWSDDTVFGAFVLTSEISARSNGRVWRQGLYQADAGILKQGLAGVDCRPSAGYKTHKDPSHLRVIGLMICCLGQISETRTGVENDKVATR